MLKPIVEIIKALFDVLGESRTPSVENDVNKIGSIAKTLEIVPELEKKSWGILSEEFPKHMGLYLSGLPGINPKRFCAKVMENALVGYRADRLASIIEAEFDIPAAKAEALAGISTSVYMTLFRRLKYMEAGVTHFIWRTSGDQRVCATCAKLDGKIFAYSNPPVVRCCGRDVWTDEYCGCRCIEEPVLDSID